MMLALEALWIRSSVLCRDSSLQKELDRGALFGFGVIYRRERLGCFRVGVDVLKRINPWDSPVHGV